MPTHAATQRATTAPAMMRTSTVVLSPSPSFDDDAPACDARKASTSMFSASCRKRSGVWSKQVPSEPEQTSGAAQSSSALQEQQRTPPRPGSDGHPRKSTKEEKRTTSVSMFNDSLKRGKRSSTLTMRSASERIIAHADDVSWSHSRAVKVTPPPALTSSSVANPVTDQYAPVTALGGVEVKYGWSYRSNRRKPTRRSAFESSD
mmetsp:Transcript_4055/g.13203  ORF Transcript_4055/g.13203 Transcript_4055/m.13203 type:complete len:204 (+) Transcript_4055:183-794(+)